MNAPMFSIRRASGGDNLLLCELGRQTFADAFAQYNTPEDMHAYLDGAFQPEKQAAELADPRTVFLIAEALGKPAGYTRLRGGQPLEQRLDCARPLEIVRFYACQGWWGRGAGAALMQACLDESVRQGCDALWLDVWEQNPRAIAFYAKWGFQVVGKQAFQLGSDLQTDLLMMRPAPAGPV